MVRHSDSDSRSDDDDDEDEDDRLEWSSNSFDGDSILASEASSQVAVNDGLPMSPDQAAAVIQGWVGRRMSTCILELRYFYSGHIIPRINGNCYISVHIRN